MPLREFAHCTSYCEIYHPSIDPTTVEAPICPECREPMKMLWSVPHLDDSTSFKAFDYKGPDGRQWHIDSLHKLRGVEHSYQETGHNIRFDAWSAEPSNPDAVDGMGLEYWDGDKSKSQGKAFSFMD